MKQGMINTAGGLGRMLIQLIAVPLLVRFLGLETYGFWTLITATIGTLMVIEGGLAFSTTYFSSRAIGMGDDRALMESLTIISSLLFLIGLAGASALFFTSEWVATSIIKANGEGRKEIVAALQWSSVVLMVRLLQQIPVGLLQAFQRYGLYNSLAFSQTLITSGSLLVVAWSGGGVRELMLVDVMVSAGSLLMFVFFGVKQLRGRNAGFRWKWERFREIARYSLLTWGGTVGALLFSNGDRLIVGFVLGPKIAGTYAIVISIVTRINQLSALSVQPLMPAIGGGAWVKYRDKADALIAFSYRTCATVSFFLIVLLVSFAGWVLNTFLGQPPGDQLIASFSVATLIYGLYSLNAPGYYIMLGLGHVGRNLFIVIAGSFISLVGIYLGGTTYGLGGAILGNSGYLLTLALNFAAGISLGTSAFGWLLRVRVPLVWCALSLSLNLLTSNFYLRMILVAAEVSVLLVWYARVEREAVAGMVSRFRPGGRGKPEPHQSV